MKKKILSLCLVLALGATAIIGGTLAYFTDTDSATNTFEAGKVGISLDEAVVEINADDNLVAKESGERTSEVQNYKLHPGQIVTKDPTIHVDEDSLNAYVGAMVKITGDLYDLIGVESYENIDITQWASGGLIADPSTATTYNGLWGYETDKCFIYQDADKENNMWVLYIFLKAAQPAGQDIVLFDKLTVPTTYDNAEMAKMDTMQIDITAFATQTEGFGETEDSCYKALTAAFPDQFKFN